MWIGPVRLAYGGVWNTFVTACEQSGCVVKPRAFTEPAHVLPEGIGQHLFHYAAKNVRRAPLKPDWFAPHPLHPDNRFAAVPLLA